MKAMVPLIDTVAKRLGEAFEKQVKAGDSFELKEQFGKFSIDAIASCAFGVDSNAFATDVSPFVENARMVFRNGSGDLFKFVLAFGIPGGRKLLQLFKIPIMKEKPTIFYYNILKEVTKQRREGKIKRNDLIDMMLESMDSTDGHNIDDITMFATALVMFVAGYDTTAQTLSYAGYELAMNPGKSSKSVKFQHDPLQALLSRCPKKVARGD